MERSGESGVPVLVRLSKNNSKQLTVFEIPSPTEEVLDIQLAVAEGSAKVLIAETLNNGLKRSFSQKDLVQHIEDEELEVAVLIKKDGNPFLRILREAALTAFQKRLMEIGYTKEDAIKYG